MIRFFRWAVLMPPDGVSYRKTGDSSWHGLVFLRMMTPLAILLLLSFSGCQTAPAADPTEPGVIFTFAGDDPGFNPDAETRQAARFRGVGDLAVSDGWLYVTANRRISRINLATDEFETIAGNGESGPIPDAIDNPRETPLPGIGPIDIDPGSEHLYALLFSNPPMESAVVRFHLTSGSYEVLLRKDRIRDIQALGGGQVLLSNVKDLFRYDPSDGEVARILPGIDLLSFVAGKGKTAFLATRSNCTGVNRSEAVILKADLDAGSVEVVAGPFKRSPFLPQVREDADLLLDPCLVPAHMAVAPSGQLAVLDVNRHGASIGLVDPDGAGDFPVIAGTGPHTHTGDGKLATEATISRGPMVFDEAGNLYIAAGPRIRRINRPPALD